MKVAFLGLGIMGRSMAANLVKAGHEVTVWNRTPGKTVERARVASTPAEAARGCQAIWICVSDTKAVEEVLFGQHGVADVLQPGTVVADSSTILPEATEEFGKRVEKTGAHFLDAPVTGSKAGAADGTLTFMLGGDAEVIARVQPLLNAMGKKFVHLGKNGAASSAKIALNMMNAMIVEGFAEGLTLARKLGVDPDKLLELIQASFVRSGIIDFKGPMILRRDFDPNFPLRLMHKDLKLNLEAAKKVGVEMPGLEAIEKVYQQATEAGLKDLDYIATIEVLEKMAGMETAKA
ncbi:MAG TPA: NAD(P)-dependent oxidoreductase [Terriglobales bacterium]